MPGSFVFGHVLDDRAIPIDGVVRGYLGNGVGKVCDDVIEGSQHCRVKYHGIHRNALRSVIKVWRQSSLNNHRGIIAEKRGMTRLAPFWLCLLDFPSPLS